MVVALITSATLWAVPALQHPLQNRQTEWVAHDFLRSLQRARQEAIRRQQGIVVAPRCNNDWNQGWLVFMDHSVNGTRTPFSNLDVLFVSEPVAEQTFIGADSNTSAFSDTPNGESALACDATNNANIPATYHVRFDHQGRATRSTGGFMTGSIAVQRKDNLGIHYKIVLSVSGKARICKIESTNSENAC